MWVPWLRREGGVVTFHLGAMAADWSLALSVEAYESITPFALCVNFCPCLAGGCRSTKTEWIPFVRETLGVDAATILVGHSAGGDTVLRTPLDAAAYLMTCGSGDAGLMGVLPLFSASPSPPFLFGRPSGDGGGGRRDCSECRASSGRRS